MTGRPDGVHTKIVATVGPASRGPETLARLVAAGVDLFRINFSHGTHAEHSATLAAIREAGDAAGRPLGVLVDLGGPKIRLGELPGGSVECALGEEFTLVTEPTGHDPRQLTSTYRELPHDLAAGNRVLFADGAVGMEVLDSGGGRARLKVTLPGTLRSHQGINLPGAPLKVPALTDKDLADLDWIALHAVEYVGQSFVRRGEDVAWLRRELEARGIHAQIVAKIEKPEAVADLDAILGQADAVMVARGDLGVEMDVAAVPAIQKRVIAACSRARRPVITATQMLTSMESSSRPTRAEASDVFNAVLDGTDAVMLSGETAIGQYPIEAVATMRRILAEAEDMLLSQPFDPGPTARRGWIQPITEAVVEAAGVACRRLDPALLVVATRSGRTALALSKYRLATRTLALTDDPRIARSTALHWGVTPLVSPPLEDAEPALAFAEDWARRRGLIAAGDCILLVRGTLPGKATHNALLVQEVE